ncbi:MAG: hypothetical protein KJ593_07435 [Candidatus Omnitrophica bacterium]|nr:hypothetical protein [Candidatus Omnitrophota bacterium]
MDNVEKLRRIQLKESIESQCKGSIEEKITRYLEIEHQGIVGGHYFAKVSSECIYLYRDGYFIGAVMMSHAINEGIIKFIAERNNIERHKEDGITKTIKELIDEFNIKNIISQDCADASTKIWESFRADIHHMNPKIAEIPFRKLAQQNLKCLSTIEKEIFGHDNNKGAMVLHQPKYWDINKDGTTSAFLRLE